MRQARTLARLVVEAPEQAEIRFVIAYVALQRGDAWERALCRAPTTRWPCDRDLHRARLPARPCAAGAVPPRRGSRRAAAVPERGAARADGRARPRAGNPGSDSALESRPMPLRLRLLPSPADNASAGDTSGPTQERASRAAGRPRERSRIGPRRSDIEIPCPTRRCRDCTRA